MGMGVSIYGENWTIYKKKKNGRRDRVDNTIVVTVTRLLTSRTFDDEIWWTKVLWTEKGIRQSAAGRNRFGVGYTKEMSKRHMQRRDRDESVSRRFWTDAKKTFWTERKCEIAVKTALLFEIGGEGDEETRRRWNLEEHGGVIEKTKEGMLPGVFGENQYQIKWRGINVVLLRVIRSQVARGGKNQTKERREKNIYCTTLCVQSVPQHLSLSLCPPSLYTSRRSAVAAAPEIPRGASEPLRQSWLDDQLD